MIHNLYIALRSVGLTALLILASAATASADRQIQSEFIPAFQSDAIPTTPSTSLAPDASYSFLPVTSGPFRGRLLTGGGKPGYLKACGAVQFGVSCYPKSAAYMVTREFSDYLMDEMPKCVSAGLKAQGFTGRFKKMTFIGDTYANREIRGGGSLSMHSTGRSLDLEKVKIQLDNGSEYDVNMTINGMLNSHSSKFYKSVVACWQNANRSRCAGKGGLTPRSGALDATYNADHHSHVHISMPFCPHKRGIAQN